MTPAFLRTPYALIDAARTGPHTDRLRRMADGSRCLFRGESEAKLGSLAPHLLELGNQNFMQNPLLQSGWGEAWYVLVNAECSLETLWRHFRKFLILRTESGGELYFRFYDPRALRKVLPVFTGAQLRDFFGPVTEFVLEDADPAFALRYSLQDETLKKERLEFRKPLPGSTR